MLLEPYIEHTLLKPDTTRQQIEQLCDEAIQYQFKGVCVNSCWIELIASRLSKTSIIPVSVIGFPLGAMETQSKAYEAKRAHALGAQEIDMVLNVGMLKSGDSTLVKNDITEVVKASRASVKVIIETALLTQAEKVEACLVALHAGAHFVKTCSGFSGGYATVEDVMLMRDTVGERMGIKASAGIKNKEDAMKLIKAGATRLGTSSAVSIIGRT